MVPHSRKGTTFFVFVGLLLISLVLLAGKGAPETAVAQDNTTAPNVPAEAQCFYAEADAYAWDYFGSNQDQNYGDADSLDVASIGDVNLDRRYTFIRFNLDPIPNGATVLSADLELYLTDIDETGAQTYTRLEAVEESWAEMTLTWNNQPDFTFTNYDEQTVSDTSGWKTWQADALVNEWVTGQRTNHGLAVISGGLGSLPAHFHSREGSTTRQPRLCVTWTEDDVNTDLTVTGIEVTQAIQDLNNSVRLVAGKRTYVRVHVSNSDGRFRTFATLEVDDGANSSTLHPINENAGHIVARTNPNRGTLNQAFLFQLPSSYTSGNVTLTADVNPITSWRPNRYPPETNYGNNSESVSVSFEEAPRLGLITYLGEYTVDDGSGNLIQYTTPYTEADQLEDWLRRAYPISDIWMTVRRHDFGEATLDGDDDFTNPTASTINAWLETKREWDLNHDNWYEDRVGDEKDIRYYTMMIDEGGFMRGRGKIDGHVASGPTGDGAWGWDFDDSYGDWYGGHELGHNFARYHAEVGCGSIAFDDKNNNGVHDPGEDYPDDFVPYPHPNGRISPSLNGDNAIFGFDIGSPAYGFNFALREQDIAIYDPGWRDVMTYCDNQWIGDFTYHDLMDYFQNTITPLAGTAVVAPAELEQTDRLLVVGNIDPDTGDTILQPLFVIPEAADTNPRTPGNYDIVLRDGGGGELARYVFTPEMMHSGPAEPGESITEAESLFISELVPYVAGTAAVEIEGPSGVLASVGAGGNTPSVTVTDPNGGESLSEDQIEVTWTGSDPDGDPLTYNVQFSQDNGATWEMVSQNIVGTSTTISRDNLPTTGEGLFRVWVSDGIHTASDVSDGAFSLATRYAEVEIVAPADGVYVGANQTLSLEANAYSPNIGTLDDDQIRWFSSVDLWLGEGAELSVSGLTPGRHNIAVFVDDGTATRSDVVEDVTVVEDPRYLPTLDDGLDVGPGVLAYWPEEGVITKTLFIDNRSGADSIDWAAAPTQSWVNMETSGATPAEVEVSVDAGGLEPGTHTAIIILGSSAAPGDLEAVDVTVSIPFPAPEPTPLLFVPLVMAQ